MDLPLITEFDHNAFEDCCLWKSKIIQGSTYSIGCAHLIYDFEYSVLKLNYNHCSFCSHNKKKLSYPIFSCCESKNYNHCSFCSHNKKKLDMIIWANAKDISYSIAFYELYGIIRLNSYFIEQTYTLDRSCAFEDIIWVLGSKFKFYGVWPNDLCFIRLHRHFFRYVVCMVPV